MMCMFTCRCQSIANISVQLLLFYLYGGIVMAAEEYLSN